MQFVKNFSFKMMLILLAFAAAYFLMPGVLDSGYQNVSLAIGNGLVFTLLFLSITVVSLAGMRPIKGRHIVEFDKNNTASQQDLLEVICPKCKQKHRYILSVKKVLYVFGCSPVAEVRPTEHAKDSIVHYSFTRLFTCPIKNEEFQVRFSLADSTGAYISDVTVGGIKHGYQAQIKHKN